MVLRLSTTIDLDLQHSLERQLALYVKRNASRGIRNAAALLVDTRDMGIKAMVGYCRLSRCIHQGQVNGTLAKRSPGSTLKPFIYGLGFDQGGVAAADDRVAGCSHRLWSLHTGKFRRQLSWSDYRHAGLIRSRNISPRYWVASQRHQTSLYDFLQQAGGQPYGQRATYGLSLVLGGGEVSMQELAGLYAMLANRGVLRPLRLRAGDPQVEGTRLLRRRSQLHVMDILAAEPAPGRCQWACSLCACLSIGKQVLRGPFAMPGPPVVSGRTY